VTLRPLPTVETLLAGARSFSKGRSRAHFFPVAASAPALRFAQILRAGELLIVEAGPLPRAIWERSARFGAGRSGAGCVPTIRYALSGRIRIVNAGVNAAGNPRARRLLGASCLVGHVVTDGDSTRALVAGGATGLPRRTQEYRQQAEEVRTGPDATGTSLL